MNTEMKERMNFYKNSMNTVIEFDNQLDFKEVACYVLDIDDCFYFDSVYGVNANTNKNIKGLKCDGTMTFLAGIKVLKRMFVK